MFKFFRIFVCKDLNKKKNNNNNENPTINASWNIVQMNGNFPCYTSVNSLTTDNLVWALLNYMAFFSLCSCTEKVLCILLNWICLDAEQIFKMIP